MGTGLYPFLPAAGLHWALRRRNQSSKLTLTSAAQEWVVSVAGAATRPLGFLGERLHAGAGESGRPVILLHGYAMNRACFLSLARRLAKEGVGPIYGFEYWSLGKVSSASRALDRFIEALCERHGCEQVDLIGHSMGGLVARYYLTLGPGRERDRVANLMTLGTPHGGSIFSGFGIGHPKKQLRPQAAFMERLRMAPLHQKTRLFVVWSRADALVGTLGQARWHGAEEVVYDDLGHVSLLYSRRVAREVAQRIKDPVQTESPSLSEQSSHR
jgi:pimeloyl-ACP methyl ester carboxylesterase